MQTTSERAADSGDLQRRYVDIYDQALTFMHVRRGMSFARALSSAMAMSAFKYLMQYDTPMLKVLGQQALKMTEREDQPA